MQAVTVLHRKIKTGLNVYAYTNYTSQNNYQQKPVNMYGEDGMKFIFHSEYKIG